jgi:hypothetical protein
MKRRKREVAPTRVGGKVLESGQPAAGSTPFTAVPQLWQKEWGRIYDKESAIFDKPTFST